MDILASFPSLSIWQITALVIVALIVGLGKSGISAATLLAIPILAQAFGAKESTGLMLMLFLLGDVFAVRTYNRHAQWDKIGRILPAAVAGLIIGALVGQQMDDQTFKMCVAFLILASLIFMLYQAKKGSSFVVPNKFWFIIPMGILAGFSTMIGNAAGPIFAIYVLAIGLNKDHYLGTTAWFFLIINLIKLPLQIFAWHNINGQTFLTALVTLPLIYIGLKLGVALIKKLNEKTFRYVILIMTAIAAIRMFF